METSSLHQKAVLWPFVGYDAHGEPTVSGPEEINCRWEESKSQSVAEQEAPIAITSEVWVDREVELGSVMWKGELIDLPAPATELKEVVTYTETPDIKGRSFERIVLLARYKESLPTVA